jgi:DHA3 family macrolide efflux protein-like MFS transporter
LFGSRVVQFALVWWLTKETGSATVLATATLVALIPEILLGPLAGAYVDRWDRRRVMAVADGFIALVSLFVAFLFWRGGLQIWHVYLAMALRAVAGSFHWPALQASTSLMVPKAQLARVAGLNQTLNGGLNIIGPPVGALVMELLPLYGVMLVDVGTALLAISPLLFIAIPRPPRVGEQSVQGEGSIWQDLRDGLAYIRGWPGLVALIAMAMVFKIALTPAFSLLPLLVSEHFSGGAAQLSLLEALAGIGIIAGGLVLSSWGGFRRKIYTILLGTAMLAAGLIILGLTPAGWFWLALGMGLVMGLAIPLVDGPIMAILQATVAPEMQGRVFTLMGSLVWITSPFGLAIAGPVSDWLGIQIWFILAGLLCGGISLAGLFIPAILNIEENNNGGVEKEIVSAPVRVEV